MGILLGLVLQMLQAASARIPESLLSGEIGAVKLGSTLSRIENQIHRQAELDFLGDGRGGLALQSKSDLRTLGLESFVGVPVSDIELLFVKREGVFRVSMVSLSIPCEHVGRLKRELGGGATATVNTTDSSWTVHDPSSKFLWGVTFKPVCSFWIRNA
jgi:hypothetical protein